MIGPMERCGDIGEFLDAPIGKYLVGGTWLYFYPTPSVSGFVLWGRLNEADLQETVRITPHVHRLAVQPHVAFIDARRVERVDTAAFAVASGYLRAHHQTLRAAISRLAVVYTPGVMGSIAAGFFRLVKAPYPVEIFETPLDACAWLGIEDAHALVTELDQLHTAAVGTTPFLRELRAFLHAHVSDATLPVAARALGISERSFQRRLADHETGFSHELAQARVRAAQSLLVDTDASLTQIAFAVGCTSLHQFSKTFRKVTGETPTQWRERHETRPL